MLIRRVDLSLVAAGAYRWGEKASVLFPLAASSSLASRPFSRAV
jgi:hypothetical protein